MNQEQTDSGSEQYQKPPDSNSAAVASDKTLALPPQADAQKSQAQTTQAEHKGSEHQSFDPVTGLIVPTFNFILFAVAAYFIFRKPLKKAMMARKAQYLGLREDTQKLLKEAEGKLAEINKKYNNLDADMIEIVNRAKATGEIEARRIIEEAHATANHIRRETDRIIAHELQMAKKELQTEIIHLATDTVNKKIKNELTLDASRKFNEKLVLEISKA